MEKQLTTPKDHSHFSSQLTAHSSQLTAHIGNSRGQSLIQVLISAAIMGIMMMAFVSMMINQTRETSALTQKLAAMDFQQQLTRSFADGTLCAALLKGQTFDSTNATASSTNPPSITLANTSIAISTMASAPALATAGQPVSPVSTSLLAAPTNTFQITNIVGSSSSGVGNFSATFNVNFDETKLVRALKAATSQITLQTTSIGSSQRIVGCTNGISAPHGGCEQYIDGSGTVIGNRFCWGAVQDNGTSMACLNGSSPIIVNSADDSIGSGGAEQTSNGADLYSLCNANGPHDCQVSTYFCF